mgnify:CR=1 FL=1
MVLIRPGGYARPRRPAALGRISAPPMPAMARQMSNGIEVLQKPDPRSAADILMNPRTKMLRGPLSGKSL